MGCLGAEALGRHARDMTTWRLTTSFSCGQADEDLMAAGGEKRCWAGLAILVKVCSGEMLGVRNPEAASPKWKRACGEKRESDGVA